MTQFTQQFSCHIIHVVPNIFGHMQGDHVSCKYLPQLLLGLFSQAIRVLSKGIIIREKFFPFRVWKKNIQKKNKREIPHVIWTQNFILCKIYTMYGLKTIETGNCHLLELVHSQLRKTIPSFNAECSFPGPSEKILAALRICFRLAVLSSSSPDSSTVLNFLS